MDDEGVMHLQDRGVRTHHPDRAHRRRAGRRHPIADRLRVEQEHAARREGPRHRQPGEGRPGDDDIVRTV